MPAGIFDYLLSAASGAGRGYRARQALDRERAEKDRQFELNRKKQEDDLATNSIQRELYRAQIQSALTQDSASNFDLLEKRRKSREGQTAFGRPINLGRFGSIQNPTMDTFSNDGIVNLMREIMQQEGETGRSSARDQSSYDVHADFPEHFGGRGKTPPRAIDQAHDIVKEALKEGPAYPGEPIDAIMSRIKRKILLGADAEPDSVASILKRSFGGSRDSTGSNRSRFLNR